MTRDDYYGTIAEPLSAHQYAYGQGDPANRIDPSGHDSLVEFSFTSAMNATLQGIRAGAAFVAKNWMLRTVACSVIGSIAGGIDAYLGNGDVAKGMEWGAAAGAIGGLSAGYAPAALFLNLVGTGVGAIGTIQSIRSGHWEQASYRAALTLFGMYSLVKYFSGEPSFVFANRESTGRVTPNNINEQLAMKEVLSDPTKGTDTKLTMGDTRWPASDGWQKWQYIHELSSGEKIVIHYVHQAGTNIFDDFKFVDN